MQTCRSYLTKAHRDILVWASPLKKAYIPRADLQRRSPGGIKRAHTSSSVQETDDDGRKVSAEMARRRVQRSRSPHLPFGKETH